MKQWDKDQIISQEGKVIIITGGGSGIGLEAAEALASKGAEVIIAVRNTEKGNRAAVRIKTAYSEAKISVMHIDLGDLSSVRQFVDQFKNRYNRLSILINYAGVMVPPYRKTIDGHELQHRLNCNGAGTKSVACHPGISNTNLVSRGSGKEAGWVLKQAMKMVAQPARSLLFSRQT
ncbi:MAG TPA: SDR family NAD(P)-dependent oxidoreductase [Bacteroidales bacterium]|nr:SDR family NAD(P)-dependent oxidoreductase [Bacteroidales bacterium]